MSDRLLVFQEAKQSATPPPPLFSGSSAVEVKLHQLEVKEVEAGSSHCPSTNPAAGITTESSNAAVDTER